MKSRQILWHRTLIRLCRCLLLAAALSTSAGQEKIEVRERLNLAWSAELLTYPFEAPEGSCHPASITLTGPAGAQPVQLIEVESWPGTPFVRRARLAFVTDLAPLESRLFTLDYGTAPVAPMTSDLKAIESPGQLELSNSRFGLRLRTDALRHDPPAAPGEVPGPLRGVRLANGTWTGGSRLYGETKLSAYGFQRLESGPVLERVQMRYEYEDGREMTLTVQLAAGAAQAEWAMLVSPYDPVEAARFVLGSGWDEAEEEASRTAARDGWQWLLNPGFDNLALAVQHTETPDRNRWGTPRMEGKRGAGGKYTYAGMDLTPQIVDLMKEPVGKLADLLPWAAFHQTRQSVLTFTRIEDVEARSEELQFAVLDPGVWVEATEPGTWASYMNVRIRHKAVPLVRGADDTVYLDFNTASGHRRWQVGIPDPVPPEKRWSAGYQLHGTTRRIGTRQATWSLNVVKDLILEWRDHELLEPLHPEIVNDVDAVELARCLQSGAHWSFSNLSYRDGDAISAYRMSGRAPEVGESLRLVERLGYFLSAFGNLDRWRYGTRELLPTLYDEVIRSGLVDEAQRRLYRAQMAYLGYAMNDPGDWSPERGWASGNLNMTIYNVLTLSHIASRIPDHPLAPHWGAPAAIWANRMLEMHVGPKGEFLGAGESLTHYAWGSAAAILKNARLARAAGGPDYINDPRMKKMVEFFAKIVTPPDPRPHNFHPTPRSVTPPVGRGTVYNAPALFGMMAEELETTDPELARDLWWAWQRANPGERAAQPVLTPDWRSEWFPETGVILRHGLDTARESYAFFVLEHSRVAYASEQAAFAAIWARGVPIAVRFGGKGYAEREELLISRVLPAWNPGDRKQRFSRFEHEGNRELTHFSALPRQDYLTASIELAKAEPKHHGGVEALPAWPVMEAEAALPVHWQRQVLFMKGPETSGPNYFVFRDTITGDQPTRWQYWTLTEKVGRPEETANVHAFLADKPGNRMQDARLIEGDRFTAIGQYGVDIEYYIASPRETPRHTLRWGLEHAHYTENQDLLHLQMPGDGVYFVVLFPRDRNEAAPQFETKGNGHIIRVNGDFGSDHLFMSASETEAEADGIRFRGTAASVQERRTGGKVISLGAAGEVQLADGTFLASIAPVSLQTGPVMTVIVPMEPQLDHTITLRAPGALSLLNAPPGVTLTPGADGYRLTMPPEVRLVLMLQD